MNKYKYYLKRSNRKTVSVSIDGEANIIVRAPLKMKVKDIDDFLASKSIWIDKHVSDIKEKIVSAPEKLTEQQISELKKLAKIHIPPRVAHFASLMGVEYNKIAFRTQKTRYGSCSSKKNLNFNIVILLMPSEIMDYVIVHELAHLKEMNHSPMFWNEVGNVISDYKDRRKWLTENGLIYVRRL